MHDFNGLLHTMGRELMLARLHLLFNTTCTSTIPDVTGLIGCYAQGNEPSHHVIFWYFLLGEATTAHKRLDQASAASEAARKRTEPSVPFLRTSSNPSRVNDDPSTLRQVVRMYTNASDGLPGNDDAGQMSAWLVLTMLGWYPVDPTNSSVLTFRPRVKLRGRTKRLACLMGCRNA